MPAAAFLSVALLRSSAALPCAARTPPPLRTRRHARRRPRVVYIASTMPRRCLIFCCRLTITYDGNMPAPDADFDHHIVSSYRRRRGCFKARLPRNILSLIFAVARWSDVSAASRQSCVIVAKRAVMQEVCAKRRRYASYASLLRLLCYYVIAYFTMRHATPSRL